MLRRVGIEDDHLGRLVVCELVTNAWRHGEGPIVVRLYLDARDGLPVVEVWDSGAGRPVVRPPDDGAVCGRGLLLVAGFVRVLGRPAAQRGRQGGVGEAAAGRGRVA